MGHARTFPREGAHTRGGVPQGEAWRGGMMVDERPGSVDEVSLAAGGPSAGEEG